MRSDDQSRFFVDVLKQYLEVTELPGFYDRWVDFHDQVIRVLLLGKRFVEFEPIIIILTRPWQAYFATALHSPPVPGLLLPALCLLRSFVANGKAFEGFRAMRSPIMQRLALEAA